MNLEPESDPRSPRPTTVFLSYARADADKAKTLVKGLEFCGLSVWWDGLISGGHEFSERIQKALAEADCVVVLWSKASSQSHWVRDEAGDARDRKRLVPVSLDGSNVPLGFRQVQCIDFSRWNGRTSAAEFRELDGAIRSVCGSAEDREPAPSARAMVGRRTLLMGSGAVAVAGMGIGGAAWWFRGTKPTVSASIAVLPFRNLGGEAGDEYFSDGLAEELRATLSRVAQLAVAAQTSSDNFRERKTDARGVAKALGVDFLLEGSLRRSADLIRVSARIVDGTTGFDKWSQSFDRKATDSLSLQSAIAAFVTDAVLAGLAKDERPSERIGGTRNSEAFDAYLRGTSLYALAGGEQSDRGALAAFDVAVAKDPGYAAAHAARSRALTVIANNYAPVGEIPSVYKRSIDAAREAVRIAPDMAEGHSALGFVLFNGQLDAGLAKGPYQRSFELGYGNAEVLSAYANFAGRTGQFVEGREAITRAERLDPLNPAVFRNAGLLEYAARDYVAARTPLRTALSLNPKARIVQSTLGDIALMEGDPAAARALYEQEPDEASRWRGLAIAEAKLGRMDQATAAYDKLVKIGMGASHYQQAQVMAQWGRGDDALGFLEQALALRDAGLVRLRNDPLLDPVRTQPRFIAIEREIGFG